MRNICDVNVVVSLMEENRTKRGSSLEVTSMKFHHETSSFYHNRTTKEFDALTRTIPNMGHHMNPMNHIRCQLLHCGFHRSPRSYIVVHCTTQYAH